MDGRESGNATVNSFYTSNIRGKVADSLTGNQHYILRLTLGDRKVNAVDFTSAFSLSVSRFLSSMRLKYFPLVTWRSRKGWPHLMWLPLHLTNTGQT